MGEVKQMIRVDEQKPIVQNFHSNFPNSTPSASSQSRLSSASMPVTTPTAQEAHQAHLFLPNCELPTASAVHEVLKLHHESNPEKGITRPLKSMTQEENRQRPKVQKKVSW